MNKWGGRTLLMLFACLAALRAHAEEPYAKDTALGGVESPYTGALVKMLKEWPPAGMIYSSHDENPVVLQCYSTADRPDMVGVRQAMMVNTPLEAVAAVLDDFDHYPELFPDLKGVQVLSRDRNRLVTAWEERIPIPFVPNVKYRMAYLIDSSIAGRRVYRYQFLQGNYLKSDDGIIVLEKAEDGKTRYTEFDFFESDSGLAKTFAPDRIWRDSIEGIYKSDVAVKLRAEHPDWKYDRIRDETEKVLEKYPVTACIKDKAAFKIESKTARPGV